MDKRGARVKALAICSLTIKSQISFMRRSLEDRYGVLDGVDDEMEKVIAEMRLIAERLDEREVNLAAPLGIKAALRLEKKLSAPNDDRR